MDVYVLLDIKISGHGSFQDDTASYSFVPSTYPIMFRDMTEKQHPIPCKRCVWSRSIIALIVRKSFVSSQSTYFVMIKVRVALEKQLRKGRSRRDLDGLSPKAVAKVSEEPWLLLEERRAESYLPDSFSSRPNLDACFNLRREM